MSKKRKTLEQKIHAQEKKIRNTALPQDHLHAAPHTYSIKIAPVRSQTTSISARTISITPTPAFVIHDLTRSIITALSILCVSALISFVIKQTDVFSLFHL